MLKIGLTGGIGSGKSTVAKIFSSLGIPVLDADKLARQIMETDPVIQARLKEAFGPDIYREGELNRPYLSKIVFADPWQLERLNAITHPVTIAAGWEWASRQEAPYIVKEAALFFEAGSADGLDAVIGVTAPEALRIQRVMKRDGIGRQEVLTRMSRQIDEAMKMRLCDWVIVNDGQKPLIEQVLTLHELFLKGIARPE